MKYKVIDPDTEELLQFLYPHKSNCNKRGTNEVCGGCDECLLKQYEYYGYIIEKENNNV